LPKQNWLLGGRVMPLEAENKNNNPFVIELLTKLTNSMIETDILNHIIKETDGFLKQEKSDNKSLSDLYKKCQTELEAKDGELLNCKSDYKSLLDRHARKHQEFMDGTKKIKSMTKKFSTITKELFDGDMKIDELKKELSKQARFEKKTDAIIEKLDAEIEWLKSELDKSKQIKTKKKGK
jgi:chromosome segregation ATPase